jgi:O-antigen/teichoic acid export membrane protein
MWSGRLSLLAALPVAVFLIVLGQPILSLVFGEAYGVGGTALGILCAGQLANAATGSLTLILNMTGHERDTVMGLGSAAIVNVILNLLLIPRFGIEGAAAATAISVAAWNALLLRKLHARLGISSTAWRWRGEGV